MQQMLGHKSATMTLDLDGHLFPDQLDEVADRLDGAARAVVYPLCTRCVPGPTSSRYRRAEKTPNPSEIGGGLGGSPDGIRTRATALRGRRARPLHNGALAGAPELLNAPRQRRKPYR